MLVMGMSSGDERMFLRTPSLQSARATVGWSRDEVRERMQIVEFVRALSPW
jgi:hypothetical protein